MMDWDAILQQILHSGVIGLIVLTIVGVLLKLAVKWIGDKLGWDEEKKRKTTNMLTELAKSAIRGAEQSAKHKKFDTPEEQSVWKENYAVNMVMELAGIDSPIAKSVVRAVFNDSEFNHVVKASHDKVHKFDEDEVSEVVKKIFGDK
jgi:hypothetical protein